MRKNSSISTWNLQLPDLFWRLRGRGNCPNRGNLKSREIEQRKTCFFKYFRHIFSFMGFICIYMTEGNLNTCSLGIWGNGYTDTTCSPNSQQWFWDKSCYTWKKYFFVIVSPGSRLKQAKLRFFQFAKNNWVFDADVQFWVLEKSQKNSPQTGSRNSAK